MARIEFVDRKDAGISHSGSYLATLAAIIKGTLLPVAAAVRLRPEILWPINAHVCDLLKPIGKRIVIVLEQMG